jgi:3-oxoadipate enol-lactonase
MAVLDVNGAAVEVETTGAGRDLVLLPTLLAEITVYDEVLPALSTRRRVHRINFPGFGGSTGPVGPAIADYADLIAAAMRKLALSPETDLLGNGFGGFVAGSMAIRHGDLFDRLVLVDTGPGFPEAAHEPLRLLAARATGEGMAVVLDAAVKRMFPESYIAGHGDVIDRRKAQLAKADPSLFANAALALTRLDNTALLGEIKNPTLIVVGLDDQTTPPALSHSLNDGIAGAQLIELPGIGHCPQLQDPAAFLAAVKPFLGLAS